MEFVTVADSKFAVKRFQQQFPGKGQDSWSIGRHSVAVTDGATPLASDWPQDISQFARRAAELLVGFADSKDKPNEEYLWQQTVRSLTKEFGSAGYKRSAGAAVVREYQGKLRISSVGDVASYIETRDKNFRIMNDELPQLDESARQSSNFQEAVRINRSRANTKNGYVILSDVESIGQRSLVFDIEAEKIERLWIMTDGCWNVLPQSAELVFPFLNDLGKARDIESLWSDFVFGDDATLIDLVRVG
jgi:hypothetical protein